MSEIIVGIDLGTTNSEVAIVRDGRVEVIASEDGKILPSMVGIGDDGALLVGLPARNQYALRPEHTVRSIKRRMGEDCHVQMGDESYRPQEISAMILRRLKQIAEAHVGETVGKAVITVPAYFSDAQRQATREAGEIAGLEVARIINEPTAAALAYESAHKGARKALVYDLGGGTFDVSVVNIEGDVVEVLASHGNNHLGGDDFDQRLLDHLIEHLRAAHGVEGPLSLAVMARLQRAAENAKIALSDRPFVQVIEEFLLEHAGKPVNLVLEIDRHDYETMIEPYIAETLSAVHIALSGAHLTVADLDEVILVGGATRTPMIGRRLQDELGIAPHGEVDPDLCVAMGAAIQAAIIAGGSAPTILIDVTPYTFGTSAVAEFKGAMYPYCFVPLIRKNSPIPVSKSEVFFTNYDGQEEVDILVYQGEDRDALNNIEIGQFRIKGLKNVPQGNPIITTFSLDLDGILHVTSREKLTGLENSIVIDNAIGRFQGQEMQSAQARLARFFDDDGSEAEIDERRQTVEARALLEKAERLLDEASPNDREDLIDAIEALRDAINQGAEDGLTEPMNVLADLLYYLET